MEMSSSPVNAGGDEHYITQINPNDVLFGRGSGPNDHEGNIRFRDLVGARKAEYMATNHRQTKAKIARDIVACVIGKNGRFLKRVEPPEAKEFGVPKGVEAWIAVDEETIMEKAKQALRQQRDKTKTGAPKSPTRSPPPPARRAISAPQAQSIDSYAKSEPRRGAEVSAADLLHAQHMQNVEAELAGYSHAAHLHPNPYEPIPIGSHAVLGPSSGLNLDWRQYTQAAIMAQTQGHRQRAFPPQPEPIPQLAVSNAHSFARPVSRGGTRRDCFVEANASDRRESIQVTDLMDSFNKMKTRGFDTQFESLGTIGTTSSRDHESIDTIETIEPLPIGPGNPSGMSMSSGNFSALMKGILSDSSRGTEIALLKGIIEDPMGHSSVTTKTTLGRPGKRDSSRQSITIDDKDFFKKGFAKGVVGSGSDFSNMSMSFSQVWNQKSPGNLGNLAEGDEGQEGSDVKPPGGPRQVVSMDDDPDNMSGLGKSSMSILNVAMGESQGESIMTANESIFSDIGD